ncbi:GMC family oxidoreductase N-terminal domain-containing protein [Sansalvadorimonas verongulae]|uniref:GMC family oxidoreductase N-terminal domain-containing protein n=1 Tax=Sansalvadorimonas verongulae TaxID=2172824 RepID=UPI0012BD7FB9|nr:GMC family oxidoreductase [Sansalvadorimonas verongulae]MTI14562.1 GMC family oxidoreductase [Sansalvadorimonas verongulae]
MTSKKQVYDFIIIGTGASGSVLAHYLSSAGADVCLLEAGKHYQAHEFPSDELHANTQLMWNGGMDPSKDARTVFLRARVAGGGTIINNCLLDRFDDIALDDFRTKSGAAFYNRATMDTHYSEVESHLNLEYISESDWNGNARLYAEGFDKLGLQRAPLRRGQNNCNNANNDCVVCLGGCPRESKQSMAVSFLPSALARGAQLKEQFHVQQIIHGPQQVAVYGSHKGHQQVLYSRKCILAAGSLGSTELLLKSGFGVELPALGQGFHCHPQFMTIALMDEIVDAHKGAFQALKSDDIRFRKQGFKLENVFAGPAAIAMLKTGFGLEHQDFMAEYRKMACIEVAIRDEIPGTIQLNNQGRLVLDKPLSDIDHQRAEAGKQQIRDIFAAVRARSIMESPLCIALHLMGGCNIGQKAADSVVNDGFEVHGFKNLVIADGSIYPMAPGINPSLTIMAQSHRASQVLLAECGYTDTSNQPEYSLHKVVSL